MALLLRVSACLLTPQILSFFSHAATTQISTLSLHDALPISEVGSLQSADTDDLPFPVDVGAVHRKAIVRRWRCVIDRKSTRLNSSHANISYAVFCLKKKNINLAYHQFNTEIYSFCTICTSVS